MKRIIILFFIFVLCISLSACYDSEEAGTTENAELDYGNSILYSEAEIQSAFDAVLIKFEDFRGCDLKRLWYDEEQSDKDIQRDISSSGSNTIKNSGAEPGNIMVLYSDWRTGESSDDGTPPDFDYFDFTWILIRNSETDDWELTSWGY